MTRKDFALIAQTLNNQKPAEVSDRASHVQWDAMCRAFASALATTNDGFRLDTFMDACVNGVTGRSRESLRRQGTLR